MLKIWQKISAAVGVLACVTTAQALNLQITQGMNNALPVAVYAFSESPVKIAGNTTVSQVITNDLTMSGRFNITPEDFNANLNAMTTKQQNQWQQAGIQDVVTGSIHKGIAGDVDVEAQLMDVSTQALLWHQTYHVPADQLRFTAHQISNQIFQKLTGTQGIFTTQLAYIHVLGKAPGAKQYRLEVADADGFGPQVLVVSQMPLMSPTWSPDGKQIAYVSFEHGKATIYVQNVVDGSRIQMSDVAGLNNAPAFSPDGQSLAQVQTVDGYPHIVLMALNTGKVTPLTSGYFADTEPSFSPDGQSLIFTSTRDGGYQLYQMNLQTHAITRVTFSGAYNASGKYFPDGSALALLHKDQGMFGIAKLALNDSAQMTLLDQNDSDASPSVAPNGQMVVYSQDYQGQRILALVSQDGQAKSRLPANVGDVQDPAWSPFLTANQLQSGES
jgi:TolB protein